MTIDDAKPDSRAANADIAPNAAFTRTPRSAARLAAVQALYQMELAGRGVEAVITEFCEHRFGAEVEDGRFYEADEAFFADLVRGAVARQSESDPLIEKTLAKGWTLSRLDSIVRALFRIAAYELAARSDIPTAVIIDEYVEVAHAFFDGEEPKFVNGALDSMARALRAEPA